MAHPIRVVLSDLDDTLFDHRRATRTALAQVAAAEPALAEQPFDDLDLRHRVLLDRLHLDILSGRRSVDDARIERFRQLLLGGSTGDPVEVATRIAQDYRSAYAQATFAVPGAIALAAAIKAAGMLLVIVTNNIVAEQRWKLDRIGLAPYIDVLVTSEEVGLSKPDAGIFRAALAAAGVEADEAVMLGDAWTNDVIGAQRAGVRAVWLNRFDEASPDPDVAELRSLEPVEAALDVITARSATGYGTPPSRAPGAAR